MESKPSCFLRVFFRAMVVCLPLLALGVVSAEAGPVKVLQFQVAGGLGSNPILDHPALNGKPNVKPIITQYYTDVYNNHPVGLEYRPGPTAANGRWLVVNEDLSIMPPNARFNVLIPTAGANADATPLNSAERFTAVKIAKGKPAAFLHFTHMTTPFPGLRQTLLPYPQSLTYNVDNLIPKSFLFQRWAIQNRSNSAPPAATRYFVFDSSKLPNNVLHTANAGNSVNNYTRITDLAALTSPTAVVFITPLDSAFPIANYGVFHNGVEWAIFNQDGATAIPNGAKFNVLFFPGLIP